MWESFKHSVFGRPSIRTFLAVVLVAITAVFANILTPHDAAALGAQWQGGDLVVDSKTYKPVPDIGDNDSRGEPAGTHVYQYLDTSTSPTTAENILFAPGSTPNQLNSASLALYDYTPPSQYKAKGAKQTISIGDGTNQAPDQNTTGQTCGVQSIGWIVCSVAQGMANGMDYLFSIISGFMTIDLLTGDSSTAVYRGWEYMRNIANVLLVIVFLILIYSNITSMGISQYGIQKSLPKLVLAAILINVSFVLCSVAIDLSNILGSSINQLFLHIGDSVTNQAVLANQLTWKNLAEHVLAGLSGITIAGLAFAGKISFAGAWTFLLPVLVGVGLAVITAVVVLAARQAIIMTLIMIAPLAFIAYILPNTNKYFDKWKDALITLLVLFPAFAVVFGAAQLAGRVMIYSATSAAQLIFGFAVMAAPLYVTPLLVKFSGGFLGRVMGIVNNPNKGLVDRTRNWGSQYRDRKGTKQIATGTSLLARRRRANFKRNRRDEEEHKRNQDMSENRYRRSQYGREATVAAKNLAHQRQLIDAEDEHRWNESLNSNKLLRERELKLRVTTDQSSLQKAIMDATHSELKAGEYTAIHGPQTRDMAKLIEDATKTSEQIALTGMRKSQAEVQEKSQLTQALLANRDAIREYAGGIRGAEGAETVLASAIASYRKEYNDRIGEKSQLMQHFNLSSNERQDVAMGRDVTKTKNGATYTFKKDDEFAREAAIDSQLKTGAYTQIKEIIDQSGAYTDASGNLVKGATYEYRTTISQLIPQAGLPGKAVFWGTKTIDDISQGTYYGDASEQAAILYNIKAGKIKANVLAGMDATALESMYTIKSTPAYTALNAAEQRAIDSNYRAMREAATAILDNPEISQAASRAAIEVFERFKI